MDAPAPRSAGFTVLDGTAFVLGAAAASVHLRDVVARNLTPAGWTLLWLTFCGIALTAAGPFVYLNRRYLRRQPDYPHIGDALWAVLGLPWLITLPLHSAGTASPATTTYTIVLAITLGIACLAALAVVWKTWVLVPPRPDDPAARRPWTDQLGLVLAIAWPVQCGLGLIVAG